MGGVFQGFYLAGYSHGIEPCGKVISSGVEAGLGRVDKEEGGGFWVRVGEGRGFGPLGSFFGGIASEPEGSSRRLPWFIGALSRFRVNKRQDAVDVDDCLYLSGGASHCFHGEEVPFVVDGSDEGC